MNRLVAPVRTIRLEAALEALNDVFDLLGDAEAATTDAALGHELVFVDVEDTAAALERLNDLGDWLTSITALVASLPSEGDELVRVACNCHLLDGKPRIEVLARSTWEAVDETCTPCSGRIHEI